MRCPYLREEQIKSCQAAPFRKSLARSAAQPDSERCSSADYRSCPMLRHSYEAHPSPARCPFLTEALAQFCAATPAVTYVPWNGSLEQRCGHDGHRFCPVFLDARGADARRPGRIAPEAEEARTELVAGVPMPGWLFYAGSHFWLDVGDDHIGHLGLDGFVAQLLGELEGLAFVTVKGTQRPAVVLTVRGIEIGLRFPLSLPLVDANLRLRASLDRLTADPYGSGWLFEVRLPLETGSLGAQLRHGLEAREWMASEVRRVSVWMHEHLSDTRLAADGGRFWPGVPHLLERDALSRLLAETFPPPEARSIR